MKIKHLIWHIGMLTLILILFFQAVSAISTIAWSDRKTEVIHAELDEFLTSTPSTYKHGALKDKSLKFSLAKQRYISSDEVAEPMSIEEAIDFEQYPLATVIATGYTAGVESTGKTSSHPEYGITYSGVKVKRDLYSTIAADLDVYPIGTILYIPNYGYGVVADKGSAITGNKIDLFYDTVDDVFAEWGKKEVEVRIVKMGDGTLTEEELSLLNEDETMQVFRQQFSED